jgi:hypothetical protein
MPVKNACIELAIKAAAGELVPDQTQGVHSKEVGPIKIVYDTKTSRTKQYLAVDRMLRPYLGSGGSMIRVVRA